jgi:hypothetical protein
MINERSRHSFDNGGTTRFDLCNAQSFGQVPAARNRRVRPAHLMAQKIRSARAENARFLTCRNGSRLDSFQSAARINLELLQNAVFYFASGSPLQYRKGFASPMDPPL